MNFLILNKICKKKIAEELGDKPINEIKNKISEIKNLFQ